MKEEKQQQDEKESEEERGGGGGGEGSWRRARTKLQSSGCGHNYAYLLCILLDKEFSLCNTDPHFDTHTCAEYIHTCACLQMGVAQL